VIFDVVCAVTKATVALCHVSYEQVFNQALRILVEIAGEANLAFKNLLICCHWVVIVERVNARNHLISQDTECPPINWLTMTLIEKHLGG